MRRRCTAMTRARCASADGAPLPASFTHTRAATVRAPCSRLCTRWVQARAHAAPVCAPACFVRAPNAGLGVPPLVSARRCPRSCRLRRARCHGANTACALNPARGTRHIALPVGTPPARSSVAAHASVARCAPHPLHIALSYPPYTARVLARWYTARRSALVFHPGLLRRPRSTPTCACTRRQRPRWTSQPTASLQRHLQCHALTFLQRPLLAHRRLHPRAHPRAVDRLALVARAHPAAPPPRVHARPRRGFDRPSSSPCTTRRLHTSPVCAYAHRRRDLRPARGTRVVLVLARRDAAAIWAANCPSPRRR